MPGFVVAVFAFTYLGMALGRLPHLRIDRAGIALVAAVVLIAGGGVAVERVGGMLDSATLLLLFGLMVLSAQFAAAGFYDGCAAALARAEGSPFHLLLLVSLVAGGLSALLANDVIAFAMTPVLCQGLLRRGLDPRPFLIALAAATNAGSAATAIGNPQNIFIAQFGRLDFLDFLAICGPPAVIALLAVPVFVHLVWRGRYELAVATDDGKAEAIPLARDRRQFFKAILATAALIGLFATPLPREASALLVAALLMASRRIASRDLIAGVDWNLLVLFACLFVVTGTFAETDLATT
ncbi:MAG: anion transporter, partial [Alphaproteobacteria bacterium]|nr:anion transporter [Alphaproteobacteria bacterium]